MTNSHRVRHQRGFTLKRSQALKAIEDGTLAWCEDGTVRDLTLAESIAKRNEQAKQREPLPMCEIPGLSFEPTLAGQAMSRAGVLLIMRANSFCGMAA